MQHALILASTSPRRRELLKQAGLKFHTASPDVDETPIPGESPRAMVRRLALDKAFVIAAKYPKHLVLAADTTVVSPDGKHILGKPRSPREAERMLTTLAGTTHTVWTGYTIVRGTPALLITRAVQTRVTMRALTRAQIKAYVATGEPMDKAGAYGAQGVGAGLIREIKGSYTSVVGLPVAQVLEDLYGLL